MPAVRREISSSPAPGRSAPTITGGFFFDLLPYVKAISRSSTNWSSVACWIAWASVVGGAVSGVFMVVYTRCRGNSAWAAAFLFRCQWYDVPMMPDKKKLTVAEAAEEAGVSVEQVMRWVDSGKFLAWNMSGSDKPGRRAIRIDPRSFQPAFPR